VTTSALKRVLELGEEAAFLWESRRGLVGSSAVTFEVLARFDQRLSSLLRELSGGSSFADRLLPDEDVTFESGRAFVSAVLALRNGPARAFDELVTRLESRAALLPPLASALAWLEYEEARSGLRRLLAAQSPLVLRLGLAGMVAHGVDPGPMLRQSLGAGDPALRAAALAAAGRLAARDCLSWLPHALEDEDAASRFWAAWSAVRLGDRRAMPVLVEFAIDGGALAQPACELALRAMGPREAIRVHGRLLSVAGSERLAVLATGMIGDPALVGWLLDTMASSALARAAGAAFCLITGRDLRRDDLDGAGPAGPPGPEAPPSGAVEEAAAEGGASPGQDAEARADEVDDDLPWPDVARIRGWWDDNRRAFVPGYRYLAGVPIRADALADVLRTGSQPLRAAAALEWALLDPDRPMLDVTAPAHRQVEG
jgi:uncharacterized protein (TIGR02270 family)